MPMSGRRASTRRSGAPLSVAIPPPSHVSSVVPTGEPSPRRHRGRHIPLRDPGLCTVSEEACDLSYNNTQQRCPSWYSNPPGSPSLSSCDTHSVFTPGSDCDEDPFDNVHLWAQPASDYDNDKHPAEFGLFPKRPPSGPILARIGSHRRPPPVEIDTRPLRGTMRSSTATIPHTRPLRTSSSATTPYPSRTQLGRPGALMPPLPIRPGSMWQPLRSAPLPSSSTFDADGTNLVSALKELLTTCGEYDEDMFADACEAPVPEQFEDAENSPILDTSPARHTTSSGRTGRAPVTPLARAAPTLPPLVQTRSEREALVFELDGSHEYLQSLSAAARAELASSHDYSRFMCSATPSSLPSLSSHGSLSSVSSHSVSSLASITEPMMNIRNGNGVPQYNGLGLSTSPPNKPRVSSRRSVRGTLPPMWTES